MKPRFAALLLAAVLPITRAAEINSLTPAESANGWVLLFDGRSLAGWHLFQSKGEPHAGWKVVNGEIVCPKTNGRPNGSGGDLVTDRKFTNFEFSFQWKISPGGNSGVHYRFDEARPPGKPLYKGDTGHSPVGFEYQILDDENHPDGKRGPTHRAGALYDLYGTEQRIVRPVGEWNESRIVVRGQHIEHWLNGVKTVDCDLDGAEYRALFEGSKYHVVPGYAARAPTSLALQDHGEAAAFRSLKIRALK